MGIKKNHVYSGDAREIMTGFPSNSVQCGVTSPPYWNLRNYNVDGQLGHEATPEEYVRKVVLICRELRRVLKENGILFLNLGDGHFKSDSPESIYKLKPKDLIGIPWRVALALQYDGWFLRSDVVWYKPNASPEGSVYDRPTRAHEYVFILTKKGRYYWDQDAVRIPNESAGIRLNVDSDYVTEEIISNSVEAIEKGKVELKKRIEKTIKDTGVTRKLASLHHHKKTWRCNEKGKNIRSVWIIKTVANTQKHFAVFPPELARQCIKAGSARGDIILDPFIGSGTTGVEALNLGRDYVGIDLNPESVKMSQEKLEFRNTEIDWEK